MIWLADKWYNAWNINSTNGFSNDVSNNAETWNSGPDSQLNSYIISYNRLSITIGYYISSLAGDGRIFLIIKNPDISVPLTNLKNIANSIVKINLGSLTYNETNIMEKVNEILVSFGTTAICHGVYTDNITSCQNNTCYYIYNNLERNTLYGYCYLDYSYNSLTNILNFYHNKLGSSYNNITYDETRTSKY